MKRFLRNQDGSASVEFVALAIPLFIPLFIYLNQFANWLCVVFIISLIIY